MSLIITSFVSEKTSFTAEDGYQPIEKKNALYKIRELVESQLKIVV